MAQSNALQLLNEWTQKQKVQLAYQFGQVPAQPGQQVLHTCTLRFSMQAGDRTGELTFQGTGTKKQDAKMVCAAAALQHLRAVPRTHPDFFSSAAPTSSDPQQAPGSAAASAIVAAQAAAATPPPQSHNSLTEAVAASVSRMHRDASSRTLAQQAVALWGGWCPLSLLALHGKAMRSALRAQQPQLAMDDLQAVTIAAAQQLSLERMSVDGSIGSIGSMSDTACQAGATDGSMPGAGATALGREQQGVLDPGMLACSLKAEEGFRVCPSGFAFHAELLPREPAASAPATMAAAAAATQSDEDPMQGLTIGLGPAAGLTDPGAASASDPLDQPPSLSPPLELAAAALSAKSPAASPPNRARRPSMRLDVQHGQQASTGPPPSQVSALLLLPLPVPAAGQVPAVSSLVQSVSLDCRDETLLSQVIQVLGTAESRLGRLEGEDQGQVRPAKSAKISHSQSRRESSEGGATGETPDAGHAQDDAPLPCQRLVVWGEVGVKWQKLPRDPPLCDAVWGDEMKGSSAASGSQPTATGLDPTASLASASGTAPAAAAIALGAADASFAASGAGTSGADAARSSAWQPAAGVMQAESQAPSESGDTEAAGRAPMLESRAGLDMWTLLPRSVVTGSSPGQGLSSSRDGGGPGHADAAEAGAGLNPIVSWLAGTDVWGPVLVTRCRPKKRVASGEPLFFWHDLIPDHLWRACAALLPVVSFTSSLKCPYMGLLPLKYEVSSSWVGAQPKALLHTYWQRHLAPRHVDAPSFQRVPAAASSSAAGAAEADSQGDVEQEDEMHVDGPAPARGIVRVELVKHALAAPAAAMGLSVSLDSIASAASGEPATSLSATAEVASKAVAVSSNALPSEAECLDAEQRAALALLHKLHTADAAVLRALAGRAPGPGAATASKDAAPAPAGGVAQVSEVLMVDPQPGAADREVLEHGTTSLLTVTPGTMVKVAFKLWQGQMLPQTQSQVSEGAVVGLGTDAQAAAPRQGPATECDAAGSPDVQPTAALAAADTGAGVQDQPEEQGGVGADQAAGSYILVEDVASARFIVGAASVRPELEQLVMGLGKGGKARCKLSIPVGGPDPLGLSTTLSSAILEARVLSVSRPAEPQTGSKVQLFSPNLAEQRRQLVAGLLARYRVSSLLDVGCGECSLILHLLKQLDDTGAWQAPDGRRHDVDTTDVAAEAVDAEPAGPLVAAEAVQVTTDGGAVGTTAVADDVHTQQQVASSGLLMDRGISPENTPAGAAQAGTSIGPGRVDTGAAEERDRQLPQTRPPPRAPPPSQPSARLRSVFGVDISDRGLGKAVKGLSARLGLQQDSLTLMAGPPVAGISAQQLSTAALEAAQPTTATSTTTTPVAPDHAQGEALEHGQPSAQHSGNPAATPTGNLPSIMLLSGSAFSAGLVNSAAWGSLTGVDAAVMIEVIEHLDPEPLSLVAPCLLGGLRPRLAMVTTPNWEYNAVMRRVEAQSGSVGLWPGPPGRDGLPLRCNDHRFEWTRAEFEAWAMAAAARYGYCVSFAGVGLVQAQGSGQALPRGSPARTDAAGGGSVSDGVPAGGAPTSVSAADFVPGSCEDPLDALVISQGTQGAGHATQAAVFVRLGDEGQARAPAACGAEGVVPMQQDGAFMGDGSGSGVVAGQELLPGLQLHWQHVAA